jgi:ABC-type Fe3+-hydroxamate transport system substrate-binding protein
VRKKVIVAAAALLSSLAVAGCTSSADTASKNLSAAADNFQINRRIQFINGMTDKVFLQIEGYCSLDPQSGELQVTCKVGPDEYKKHFLGLSNNVTYVAEQIDPAKTDPYHYTMVVRPDSLIPNIDVQTQANGK